MANTKIVLKGSEPMYMLAEHELCKEKNQVRCGQVSSLDLALRVSHRPVHLEDINDA